MYGCHNNCSKEFQHMNLISSLERDIVVDGVLKYH